MAQDYMLPTRTAMMSALKHDAAVIAMIPAASIFPGTVPASRGFPFARFGTMIASPFLASCLDSSAFRISVQAFTHDAVQGGIVVRPAEDNIILIGSAMKAALDGKTLAFPSGEKLRLTWVQTVPQQDPTEASAWMTTITFTGEVAG